MTARRRAYATMAMLLAVALGGTGMPGVSPAAETLGSPAEIRSAIFGCWDRLPWPGQVAAEANGGVWRQTVCFSRNGAASIEILGGGGTEVGSDGSTMIVEMEGWGEQGRYSLSADRVLIRGVAWDDAGQLSCRVESIAEDNVSFVDCIARSDGKVTPGENADFSRSTERPHG